MKKKENILLSLISLLFVSCFSDEKNENSYSNDFNKIDSCIKVADNEKQFIYKDFEIFKRKKIPFVSQEIICYPFVRILEDKDSNYSFRIFYSSSLEKDFEMKRVGDFWEVSKETRNSEFQGIPKAFNKIIIINDSTIIDMRRLFKLSSDYYHVTTYTKYQKKSNSITKITYSGTALTERNVKDFSLWDSITYRKRSFKPHFVTDLLLNKKSILESGVELFPGEGAKQNSKAYTQTWNHNINSNSFFYYLFRGW